MCLSVPIHTKRGKGGLGAEFYASAVASFVGIYYTMLYNRWRQGAAARKRTLVHQRIMPRNVFEIDTVVCNWARQLSREISLPRRKDLRKLHV